VLSRKISFLFLILALVAVLALTLQGKTRRSSAIKPLPIHAAIQSSSLAGQAQSLLDPVQQNASQLVEQGRQTFRFDTFGDEAFWGDTLMLHQAIEGAKLGGIGPGVSPKTAIAVGLKLDVDALPANLLAALNQGQVNLNDPATTLALLKLNAVVGVTGFFNSSGTLQSVGIQCALCHSTLDSKGVNPQQVTDGVTTATNVPGATLIPAAFGLGGVNLHTWTGWGSVPHWNAFVANLEMHGKGRFWDPRLNDAAQFPIAAAHGFGDLQHIDPDSDRISSKLPALQFYQLAIPAPQPPAGSFDAAAAARGDALFSGKAKCNNCHVEPLWTDADWNLHTPSEICIDSFQANRAPDQRYRTSPIGDLFTHFKGGFYHDGRFATLNDVVDHYNTCMALGLTSSEKNDLIQYLLSLTFGPKDPHTSSSTASSSSTRH
jgi:cytochrome c peroxidase